MEINIGIKLWNAMPRFKSTILLFRGGH
jgi:hypothetical protein